MIEVYKYTHGLYKVSALHVEVEEKTTRGHNYKKKRCSTTRRLQFFSMQVVNDWNSLPGYVVNAADGSIGEDVVVEVRRPSLNGMR